MRRRAQSATRWVVLAALVLAAAAIAVGTYRYLRPAVAVTDVVEAPVVAAFYATGTVSPVREYPIKSNLAGIVTGVFVDKGDHIKKAQSLAIVTDPALTYTADKAQAEVNEKRARAEEKTSPVLTEFAARISATGDLLEIARRDLKRVTDLLERNAGSQTDFDQALDRVKRLWSELESLKAQRAASRLQLQRELETAEAALKIAKWNLEEQTLKSPIDGVVLDRPASQGTRVGVNDHIMQVADVRPQKLVMRAAVDEEDVTNVTKDQKVSMVLYAFPGQVFTGTVSRIYDKAEPQRRTFEVDVALPPDNRMAAGMTGELAFIIAERESALVAPSQALQEGKIYTIRDGRLAHVQAQIGLRNVERVEIISGLRPGDKVVLTPVGKLKEGTAVRATWIDPAEAAGLNKPKTTNDNFKGFN